MAFDKAFPAAFWAVRAAPFDAAFCAALLPPFAAEAAAAFLPACSPTSLTNALRAAFSADFRAAC